MVELILMILTFFGVGPGNRGRGRGRDRGRGRAPVVVHPPTVCGTVRPSVREQSTQSA